MIFDIVVLILTLAAIIFALAIRERTAGKIAHSYSFMLAALGVYALISVISILNHAVIISKEATTIILGILRIIFVLLLIAFFFLMKQEIKRIGGEDDMERELREREKRRTEEEREERIGKYY